MGDEEAPNYTQLTPSEEVRVVAIELALSYTANGSGYSSLSQASLRSVLEAADSFERFILNGKRV